VDLNPTFGALGRDDPSWLGSARGTSQAQSVALVVASFTAGTHYPNGYFPSGLPLGKYTSGPNTGNYGPQTDADVTGLQNLAGYLLVAQAAPRNPATTIINGPLLDSGRVIVSKLPITVSAAAQATNPRFVHV